MILKTLLIQRNIKERGEAAQKCIKQTEEEEIKSSR